MNLHAAVIFCVVVGQKDFSVAGAKLKRNRGRQDEAIFIVDSAEVRFR